MTNEDSAPTVLPIKLTTSQVRPVVYRILSKKHGLNLKSTGLDVLAKFLGQKFGAEWRGSKAEKFLDQIAKTWKEQDRGLFVEGETLDVVLRELTVAQSAAILTEGHDDGDDGTRPKTKKQQQVDWRDYFKVINADQQPQYKYNQTRKQFEAAPREPKEHKLLGSASDRTSLVSTRYHILFDRLQRDETFQPSSFGYTSDHSLTMIKNMLGKNDESFVLMGYMTKGADGEWWLQDKSGKIQLDIALRAIPSPFTYYTPGAFVVCAGVHHNNQFVVDNLGPLPAERRNETRKAMGYIDFLGVHSALNVTAPGSKTSKVDRIDKAFEQHLRQSEQKLNHKMVILGCDIFLDQLRVIDALRRIFVELEEQPPVAIVFPGSFTSVAFQPNGSSTDYKESFDFLAQLLEEFPRISAESKLVFMPGDNDPWAATFTGGAAPAIPISPIPSIFTNRVRRIADDVVWASNPAKLLYLSQEITLVRDDYGARFRRNSIVFPKELEREEEQQQDEAAEPMDTAEPKTPDGSDDEKEDEDEEVAANRRAIAQMVVESASPMKKQRNNIKNNKSNTSSSPPPIAPELAEARKVVRTILDQGHLSPFPLATRPVYWNYDQTLQLMPLPSMLVLVDPTTPRFKVTYEGCYVVNPGRLITGNNSQCNWLEYDTSSGVAIDKWLYI